jgi:hypothetical protein
VLLSVSLIVAVAPDPAAFDIPATTALVHAKEHPGVALVAVYPKTDPLQTVPVDALLMVAIGFWLVVVLCDGDAHVGALVYCVTRLTVFNPELLFVVMVIILVP